MKNQCDGKIVACSHSECMAKDEDPGICSNSCTCPGMEFGDSDDDDDDGDDDGDDDDNGGEEGGAGRGE